MVLTQLAIPIQIFGLIFAIFWAIFLFWRAARIELYSNEEIFDVVAVSLLGGLAGGRIGAFLVEFERFKFSFDKLIFFHIYSGFNFYGFMLGALLVVTFLVRHRRQNGWKFFDMAASPLIFGLTIYSGFKLLSFYLESGRLNYILLLNFALFFILFYVIKRLESLKRKVGFFACFYLVWVSASDMLGFLLSNWGKHLRMSDYYTLVAPIAFFLFGTVFWYRVNKRIFKNDAKRIFAFFLLRFLGFIRIIRSADEAGKFSKSLIFVPFTITRRFLVLLRGLFREIKLGLLELIHSLGIGS